LENNKFGVQIQVNSDDLFDERRKEYILRNLREQAVEKLAEQITDGNFYIIRLKQSILQNYMDVMLRYEWEVSAVQSKKITMWETPKYGDMPFLVLSSSAIEEIKNRIKQHGYRLRQKLSKKFSWIKNRSNRQ